MEILKFIALASICLLGRAVLRWRYLASRGFGISYNRPPIFRSRNANSIIWITGQLLCWGSICFLAVAFTSLYAVGTLFGALIMSRIIINILFKEDINRVASVMRRIDIGVKMQQENNKDNEL